MARSKKGLGLSALKAVEAGKKAAVADLNVVELLSPAKLKGRTDPTWLSKELWCQQLIQAFVLRVTFSGTWKARKYRW